MHLAKDVRKLCRTLRKEGYEVDEQARHYKVLKDGTVLFGISCTPSDSMAWKRILADCRRAGCIH